MSYDPRTIAYLAEIIYAPMELRADAVQSIHNALYRQAGLGYQNFQIAADGIHLSNLPERPGAVSAVSFAPDRMIVREELRATTVEDFAARLVNIAGLAFRTLEIPLSLAQQFVVRSLINPRQTQDSREFLLRRVITGPEEAWSSFGRPMQRVGLSFTFPQVPEHDQVFNLRIETWNQDPRSLWIENVGSYTRPLPAERIPDLGTSLFTTYKFLTGQVSRFLSHFDRV